MLHESSLNTFEHGLGRGNQLCEIYKYCAAQYPAALDCTDILRAAVLTSVSSLDLLVHSIYRSEVYYRIQKKLKITGLRVPFNALVQSPEDAYVEVDQDLKAVHSFKSFVAPDKIGEVICHFAEHPWQKMSAKVGADEKSIKSQLKEIVKWRNRIAHEADINPDLGGILLWPIIVEDVQYSIKFLRSIGQAIALVVIESR